MGATYRTPFEFGCAFVARLDGFRRVQGLCDMAAGLAAAGAREPATRAFAEARVLAAQLDGKNALNGALALVTAAGRLDDHNAAGDAMATARSAVQQLEDKDRAFGLLTLAQHYRETGALPDALPTLDEAHAATRSIDGLSRILALSDIAAEYERCGNPARNSLLRLEVADAVKALDHAEERSSGYGVLARMYAEAGDTPAARDALERAFAGFTAATEPWTRLSTCCECARASAKLGSAAETARLLAEADTLIAQAESPEPRRTCLLFASLARVELGAVDTALRDVARATPVEQIRVAAVLAGNVWHQTPTSPAVAAFLAIALAAVPAVAALPPGRERKRGPDSLIGVCLRVPGVVFDPAQQRLAAAAAAALAAGG